MTPRISIAIAILLLSAADPQFAQEIKINKIFGPINIRNQFPATQQFLAFPAESAWMPSKHEFRLSVDYVHTNTFAKSGNIVRTLQAVERQNVLTGNTAYRFLIIGQQDDAFLLDNEIGRWGIRVSYGLSDAMAIGVELPFIQFGGGIFDRFIEHFHSTFGLPDDKRPLFARNTSEILLYFDGQLLFREPGSLNSAGFGDLVLAMKFRFATGNSILPALAVRAAAKLPTGSYRQLRGSGSFDYGINLAASKELKRNLIHLNAGVVWTGKWQALPELRLAPIYSTLIGYERLIGRYTSLVVQHLFTTSIFRKATGAGIADDSYEFTLGLKFGAPAGYRWSFSVTENHVNFNNSPDIGLHIGVERWF